MHIELRRRHFALRLVDRLLFLRDRAGAHFLEVCLHLGAHRRQFFRRREHLLAVALLVRFQMPSDVPIQTHDVAALNIAAQQRHHAFAMRLNVLAFLVGGEAGGRRTMQPNHGRDIERCFLLHGHVRAYAGRQRGSQDDRRTNDPQKAFLHVMALPSGGCGAVTPTTA